MNARMTCLLSVAVLAVACGAATAEIRLEMKRSARIPSGEIHLDQVATVLAEDASLAESIAGARLGTTPLPGSNRVITRGHILMQLGRRGIGPNEIAWEGARACRVSVRSVTLAREDIVKAARDYLRTIPMLEKEGVTIELATPPRSRQVAADEPPVLVASSSSVVRPWGRIRVNVKVVAGDRVLANIPVMFKATCRENVVFAVRPLQRGRPIRASDVEVREVMLGARSGQLSYATRLDQVVGKQAMRSVSPGVPVTVSMVVEPLAARKGQGIAIYLRSEHVEVVTKGTAQCDGRIGDVIAVAVGVTGKLISAKLVAPGTVELPL